MEKTNQTRREFVKTAATGAAAAAMFSTVPSKVLGANDKLRVAVMGTRSRGRALYTEFAKSPHTEVAYVCDVDSRVIEKSVKDLDEMQGKKPKGVEDFREALDDKDVDILAIAAPDHWHAPAALLGMKAGKHIYVEKPCGHNPHEGELLVAAQKKYNKVVQMGNQQRSSIQTIQALKELKEGIIGRPYYAKAWYTSNRGPIGNGKIAPVPEWLNWELWQGPAPRVPYRDNVVHYNWHWFWRWGTGEALNNGTHEVDVARWALGVDFPLKTTSSGGRFHYDDDWEFYDTQNIMYEFEGGKAINWEGRSCNGFKFFDRGRGTIITATEGTLIVDRNGHEFYDKKHKLIKEYKDSAENNTMGTTGLGDPLNELHVGNFIDAIKTGAKQNSHIEEGFKSVLLCQLGNISQEMGRTLYTDPRNGRIVGDPEAMTMWSRDYEPGWEMRI